LDAALQLIGGRVDKTKIYRFSTGNKFFLLQVLTLFTIHPCAGDLNYYIKMASYVAAWCNNQIKLSTKVTNPGKQFSNGYLFGELLIAIDWLDAGEWGKMTNNSTTHARLSNFAIVDACLKSKGVFYDNNLIPLIVTEARGAAADLLLKIKRCKEVHEQPPPKVVEKSTHTVRPKEVSEPPLKQQKREPTNTKHTKKTKNAVHSRSHDSVGRRRLSGEDDGRSRNPQFQQARRSNSLEILPRHPASPREEPDT
tara:strand:+ start:589 stop:1347 length:759 start_codon:yes stop_codon:yes gene_type:complete